MWTGASYNVCSLGSRSEAGDRSGVGLWGPLRQHLLQSQLSAEGISWIGLQETRLPSASCFESQGWLCVKSACTAQGQGGCSLWINQTQDWSNRLPVVKAAHVHVVVSEPHILLVRVCTPGVSVVFAVAHAPHSKRDADERDAFWHRLQSLIRSATCLRDELFVCVDANGRIWSPDGSGVALKGERANPNGLALAGFAADLDLCAPALSPCHVGPEHTWISPSGFKQRIDFVLIPSNFCQGVSRSSTLFHLEWAGLERDHFPVAVSFAMSKGGGRSPAVMASRRLPVPVLPPEVKPVLMPASWTLGVDAHLDFLTKDVQQLCKKFGQRPEPKPRRSYVSAGILQLVHLKRHLRREVRAWEQRGHWYVLRCCFDAWRANGPVNGPATEALYDGSPSAVDVHVAVHWHALSNTDRELKACLRAAKVDKLASCRPVQGA